MKVRIHHPNVAFHSAMLGNSESMIGKSISREREGSTGLKQKVKVRGWKAPREAPLAPKKQRRRQ